MLIYLDDIRLDARCDGPPAGPPLVLIHGLGADLGIWDALLPHLSTCRVLRFDLRGHGTSDAPPPPYAMGALIRDCERVMAHFGMTEAVVVGQGAGGLLAQGLGVKRLDLVRALVLANTATRMGHADIWARRIAEIAANGTAAMIDPTLQQAYGRRWRDAATLPEARRMLAATSPDGWMGVAAAIVGSDFYQTTATLRLPTLVVAGGEDGICPPDMQREIADLVPGAELRLIPSAGHLAPLDQPAAFAQHLTGFLRQIGHF